MTGRALEQLVRDLCVTGLQCLRHPRQPGARAAHRAAIFTALEALKTSAPPQPPAATPTPPDWLDNPERVGPSDGPAPDFWWNRH